MQRQYRKHLTRSPNMNLELTSKQLVFEDLQRYNPDKIPVGTFHFWMKICREAYTHPGLIAIIIFRYGGWCKKLRVPIIKQLMNLLYFLAYNFARFILQIEIPRDTVIGPGLRIDHYGGILVNSQAVIGANFTLTKDVLVGATEGGVPVIGNDVHCGVGARIIGGVTLGDCIKIGASSVVTRSFAEGYSVIAGIPAKKLRSLDSPPLTDGWIPPRGSPKEAAPNEETMI